MRTKFFDPLSRTKGYFFARGSVTNLFWSMAFLYVNNPVSPVESLQPLYDKCVTDFPVVSAGRWWMPGSLSASTPSSHLPPKKTLLHSSSEPTSPPQTSPSPPPPLSSHPPSASWTATTSHHPQPPARHLAPLLAKSQPPSSTAHSDPSLSKTPKAPWHSWVTLTVRLSLSGAQSWVRVGEATEAGAAGRVVAAGATAAPGCWSWWRKCQVIWMWQHSATKSSYTSTSWSLQTATRCSW